MSIYTMISAMKIRLLISSLSVMALALTAQAGIPAGGFAGTWAANFSKSQFPGPPPKVDMCKIDADGTVTVNETSADGKSTSWHYTPIL